MQNISHAIIIRIGFTLCLAGYFFSPIIVVGNTANRPFIETSRTASSTEDILRPSNETITFTQIFGPTVGSGLIFETCSQGGGGGSSDIALDPTGQVLRGGADTIYYFLSAAPRAEVNVSATMSGPNVSMSGSDGRDGQNASVTFASTSFLPDSQYCVNATHTYPNGGCSSSACMVTPGSPRVTNVEYEQILTDDEPIDINPNTGAGLRIYPDKKVPTENVDRRKIRVKAQSSQAIAGVRIYFRNFDVDDPSADVAPIDTNDTPNAKTGNDNNGNVDGTTATRAGRLSAPTTPDPNPYLCQPFSNGSASGVSCVTDALGQAKVDFTVTMQPGDNFTVVASSDETYISSLVPSDDGINLRDAANVQTPAAIAGANACMVSPINACRADMLPVWRRLHLEVDSMGNVGTGNKVEGTISNVRQVSDSNCNPLPPPNPPPSSPCITTATVYDVTDPGGNPINLEVQRFANGRILIGNQYYHVLKNDASSITLKGPSGRSRKGKTGKTFVLYDDDDFNDDDSLVDGDDGELIDKFEVPITKYQEYFKYLSPEDGAYTDGRPKNVLGTAYVRPEYSWAKPYDQSNVPFNLNVVHDSRTLSALFDVQRGSKNDERNDFWIAYFILGYQGPQSEDFDGGTEQSLEAGTLGVGFNAVCDCYQSSVCPTDGRLCQLNGNPVFPNGGQGSVVYLEVVQDYTNFFANPMLWGSPLPARTLNEKAITPAHELGHQFGLNGDQIRTTFMIMDYTDYGQNGPDPTISYNQEHINIIRRRVKSPGQQ